MTRRIAFCVAAAHLLAAPGAARACEAIGPCHVDLCEGSECDGPVEAPAPASPGLDPAAATTTTVQAGSR